MRSVLRRGRWRWLLVVSVGLLGIAVGLPFLLNHLVRTMALPQVEERLGCKLQVSAVQVWPTRVILRRLVVKSPDPQVPDPAIFGQVQVGFAPQYLLLGKLRLTEVRAEASILQVLRNEGGEDNIGPILERLLKEKDKDKDRGPRGGGRVEGPERVVLQNASLDVRTDSGGGHAESLDVDLQRGRSGEAKISGVVLDLPGGATARAGSVTARFVPSAGRMTPVGIPTVTVEDGAVAPWKSLALTGIAGTIGPDPADPERATLKLEGGYGGVQRTLWDASGWLRPDRSPDKKRGSEAEISLRAKRFRLSSLDPILKATPIIDSEGTQVDARLDLGYAQHALSFDGDFHMSGLSLFTARLAAEPVRGLGIDISARGRVDTRARKIKLERSVIKWRGAEAILDGEAEAQPAHLRAPRPAPGTPGADPAAPRDEGPSWRERWRQVSLHLQIPPISCQSALQAIPTEITPYLQGFKLAGMFSTDLRVSIDFAQILRLPPPPPRTDEEGEGEALGEAPAPLPTVAVARPAAAAPPVAPVVPEPKGKRRRLRGRHKLPPLRLPGGAQVALKDGADPAAVPAPAAPVAAPTPQRERGPRGAAGLLPPGPVVLSGKVGIDGCKVTYAPSEMSAERLLDTFEHSVEVEPGKVISFVVGQENPDFVPYEDISQYLINSIMTTEDNGFMRHRGFIGPEFRSALAQNLERGYFRLGASSITMQMVKNVLLSREKTLSRKLQEMFLTWYLEQNLTKERILEIYFNVIEFGPYLYGIGKATRHYFNKTPKELTPREAAWFSSILPNPKRRYVHFCKGQPDAKWEAYLTRILRRVHERGRLTDEEFNASLEERFTFNREESTAEKDCLALIKRMTTPVPAPDDPAAAAAPTTPSP